MARTRQSFRVGARRPARRLRGTALDHLASVGGAPGPCDADAGSPPATAEDRALWSLLEPRVGSAHLAERLAAESDVEAHVFGQGRNFFHPENWVSSRGLLRRILRATFLYDRGRRNAMALELRYNDIRLPRLPAAFEGFTILHLSDLHLDMNAAFPQLLADRLRGLEFDLCVLTGDFCYRTGGTWEPAIEAMQQVRPALQGSVYAVLGNHDSIRMVPGLEAMGIAVLLNESAAVRRGEAEIRLVGVDDPHYFQADDVEQAMQEAGSDTVAILLAHSPEIYAQAAEAGCEVLLCGHTHGGQIRLPGGIPILVNADCPRRLCAGSWRFGALQGYTSVGAGSSILDVRFNCPPEVTLHRLTRG